jgi:hypothetical protein
MEARGLAAPLSGGLNQAVKINTITKTPTRVSAPRSKNVVFSGAVRECFTFLNLDLDFSATFDRLSNTGVNDLIHTTYCEKINTNAK